jgi:hypothetical protein
MRNQHQVLLRRLYRIAQTTTVEDYVQRFSALVDQISAYDTNPDQLNYLTRLLDGLKPGVRVLVAIQQPADLDAAYTMALLYEELGDGSTPWNAVATPVPSRRMITTSAPASPFPQPPPQPPAKWVSRTVEEKKQNDTGRFPVDDRWNSLHDYRKSKGLCFVCGERWSKDHQCKNSIQLHIVQEMLDCLQQSDSESESQVAADTALPPQQLMQLSALAASTGQPATHSMAVVVQVHGHDLRFLIDSGSSSCFLDHHCVALLEGAQPLPQRLHVLVPGGDTLQCTQQFVALTWASQGFQFQDDFRVLRLQNYDGIIGLDWLAKHSPMIAHWAQHWLAFYRGEQLVVLHGEGAPGFTHALVELHLLQPCPSLTTTTGHRPEVL